MVLKSLQPGRFVHLAVHCFSWLSDGETILIQSMVYDALMCTKNDVVHVVIIHVIHVSCVTAAVFEVILN